MLDEQPATPPALWRSRLRRLRARVRSTLPFVSGVFAAFLAILLYNVLVPPPHQLTQHEVDNTVAQAMASATAPPAYSASVYQIIQPSLVFIDSQTTSSDGKAEESIGSGVVVDMNGDILTSLHVVDGSKSIKLTFADGNQSDAIITAQQPQNDIAVLRAVQPPALLVPATLGDPNALHIGDEAYVVGNPFGLYSSMTAGIISGFNRSFEVQDTNKKLQGLIQIDTAVNPGNSGGPLLNRAGEVVGIVAGLLNPTKQDVYIGIGFAVPITTAGGAVGLPPD